MILDADEHIEFEDVVGDPERESGIAVQAFALAAQKDTTDNLITIHFAATMVPTRDVVVLSEADFPDAEFMLSVDQFKQLLKMFLRFDEKISKAGLR